MRADGGPKIGYGHLIRTGALASELLDRGHRITYATTTPTNVREVCPSKVEVRTLPARDDPTAVKEIISDRVDAVVLDSYVADGSYQQELRDLATLVLISDDTRHRIAADMLVNGNLYADDLEYETIGTEPELYLGPDYLLLRPAIITYAKRDPPWRHTPSNAIITMGGSDIANLTPTVIRAFDGFDLQVDAIVGPGFSREQELECQQAADEVSSDVRVVRDPDNLPHRMFHADFAVTTASTTTYELLALGTPIINLPVVDNQMLIARALRKRNVATVLDSGAESADFVAAITEYVETPSLRRKRKTEGRRLVDSEGVRRIANEVLSIADSKKEL